MSLLKFIITITAAIGSANATASRLADVMSKATGYKTQLHTNVTAYDICMYLATGYQYYHLGDNTNITTAAYDDHDQGVVKIISRHVNNEYDNTTEALDTYNKTQRVVNFDVADCDGVTDDELVSWYFSSTVVGTHDQDLERSRRQAYNYCNSQGQNCRSSDGRLDVTMCSHTAAGGTSVCACAEYGPNAAACQTAYLSKDATMWTTERHRNWGEITTLMIGFERERGYIEQRPTVFGTNGNEYG